MKEVVKKTEGDLLFTDDKNGKKNSPDEIMKQGNNFFHMNMNGIMDDNKISEYSSEDGDSPTFNFRQNNCQLGFYRDKAGYLMCE